MRKDNIEAATKGRQGRMTTMACLLSTLAAPALMTSITAGTAAAQTASTIQFTTSDKVPAVYLDAITASGNATSDGKSMVDGQSRDVLSALLSWPGTELADAGTFIVNKPNSYPRVSVKDKPGFAAFVTNLTSMSKAENGWSTVTLRYVASANGSPAALIVPVPIRAVAGRDDGSAYQFDVSLPQGFIAAIGNTAKAGYNAQTLAATINGRQQDVVATRIAWNDDVINDGVFAFVNADGSVSGDNFQTVDKTDPAWPALATMLKNAATKRGAWSYATVLYAISAAGSPPTFTATYADPAFGKLGIDRRLKTFSGVMTDLSANTRAGDYFPDAKIPVRLAEVRAAMLAYGNSERMTPHFRKIVGAKVATDVDLSNPGSVKTVTNKEGKTEPVFTQPDMALDEKLNMAAQYFAEALATGNGKIHDGPAAWTDASGKVVVMTTLGDRFKYFGADASAEIATGGSGAEAGSYPYAWMAGDTHYRWYWGVDGVYPLVGYGAAQTKAGLWFYVGVGKNTSPQPPK